MTHHANRHPAARDEAELLKDCDTQRTRRSGPGGQHRNKVETAIVLTHRPTGISGQAGERRSQRENQRLAVKRLRVNLAVGIRVPVEEKDVTNTFPTQLWNERVRNRKISISDQHEDFPALLAEALDVIAALGWDLSEAAQHMKCSTSQMIKLLKKEPAAFDLVNSKRRELSLHPYR